MPLGPEYRRKLAFNRLVTFMLENAGEVNRRRKDRGRTTWFIQDKIKARLDGLGLYSDLYHQYMAYALALLKTQNRLRYMVDFIRERQILRDRFERRGLEDGVLDALDRLIIYRYGDA